MSKKNQHVLYLFGFVAIGIVLLSSPKCGRGCRTLAEHLIAHGVDALL